MPREWKAGDTAYFLPLLIERDGKKCHYCNKQVYLVSEIEKKPLSTRARQLANAQWEMRAIVEHKIPVSKGGEEFDMNNMVLACVGCDRKKGSRFPGHFQRSRKTHKNRE
jgi:5-methylcytosine-specific restriction endonuclease McrA